VAILPIYTFAHSVLRKKARPFKGVNDAVVRLGHDMMETMHRANGIGLAANQVGVTQRIITVDLTGSEGYENFLPLIMLNPEVTDEEGSWSIEEGCLSLPELRDEVERAERLRVAYRDLNFDPQVIEVEGMLGRVILHEIDHLNGVLFIDHLNLIKRRLLRGRLNKIKGGEVPVDYETAPLPVSSTVNA
jgi:peptide deformylase